MKSRILALVVLLSQRLVGEMHSGRAMPRPGVPCFGSGPVPRLRKRAPTTDVERKLAAMLSAGRLLVQAPSPEGELVPVDVLRGDDQVRVYVPRGPLGIGLRSPSALSIR